MKPDTSARNLTPTSTAWVSVCEAIAGVAVSAQSVHGQLWVVKVKSAEVARLPAASLLLTR